MQFRFGSTMIVAGALALAAAGTVSADVKTEERTQIKFEGMLGRMMGLFGGKGAKEGVVERVALKGDRKMTAGDETGEIIDLAEEKVYSLDMKKKTYTVLTFDEMRQRMKEAQEKAQQSMKQAEPQEKPAETQEPQVEIDFDMKETGQRKAILGYDCREVVMTVTMRQKGQTLEQGGGMVMATNTWLAPEIEALKQQADFDRRYAQKLYGGLVSVEAMQQMAAAMAMYPGMKDAMARMSKEQVNLSGTPLLTVTSMQSVKSEQQLEEEKKQEGESGSSSPTSVGGLMGGFLAKKMAKKKADPAETGGPANRVTIMTSTTEVLRISTDVTPADVSLPAGFKQAK